MYKAVRPLRSVKTLIVGGCPITESFVESLRDVYPNAMIRSGYGTSECGVVTLNYTKTVKGANSGCVLANIDFKVF